MFIKAILVTLIFGFGSYKLLKKPKYVNSFSHSFSDKPIIKIILKLMGYWFILLILTTWFLAIGSLFE